MDSLSLFISGGFSPIVLYTVYFALYSMLLCSMLSDVLPLLSMSGYLLYATTTLIIQMSLCAEVFQAVLPAPIRSYLSLATSYAFKYAFTKLHTAYSLCTSY